MEAKTVEYAVIILYREDGRMLFEHRTATRKRWAGYWALFGGQPEGNETPLQNVIREAKEELGYTLNNPHQLLTQVLPKGVKKHVFVEKYDGLQPLKLNPRESQGYGWFTLEDSLKLNLIPHNLIPLNVASDYIKTQLKH